MKMNYPWLKKSQKHMLTSHHNSKLPLFGQNQLHTATSIITQTRISLGLTITPIHFHMAILNFRSATFNKNNRAHSITYSHVIRATLKIFNQAIFAQHPLYVFGQIT